MKRNRVTVRASIACCEDDCAASFEGRVLLDVSLQGMAAMFGSSESVSLHGYAADDLPDGWKPIGNQISGHALYCPEHAAAAQATEDAEREQRKLRSQPK